METYARAARRSELTIFPLYNHMSTDALERKVETAFPSKVNPAALLFSANHWLILAASVPGRPDVSKTTGFNTESWRLAALKGVSYSRLFSSSPNPLATRCCRWLSFAKAWALVGETPNLGQNEQLLLL